MQRRSAACLFVIGLALASCVPAREPGTLAPTLEMREVNGRSVAMQNGIPVPTHDWQPRPRIELDGSWRLPALLPTPAEHLSAYLAERFPQVQLVPAWIDNVQRVMPKGEVVPVPILCSVTFGAPLQLQPAEDKRAFLERARDAVTALRSVA